MNDEFQPGDVVVVAHYTTRNLEDLTAEDWGIVQFFDNARGEGTVAFAGLGSRHCVPADALRAVPKEWARRIHFVDVEGKGDD